MAIIQWICLYPGTTKDTTDNTLLIQSWLLLLTSKDILQKLQSALTAIGEANLSFKADEIGTHSLCSGVTMTMCLAGIPTYIIMLIGRSSDAFLQYIQWQVQQFSQRVSTWMITNEDFFTISTTVSNDPQMLGNPWTLCVATMWGCPHLFHLVCLTLTYMAPLFIQPLKHDGWFMSQDLSRKPGDRLGTRELGIHLY